MDRESSSAADFAVDFYKAFRLADDTVNHSQAESGSGTDDVLFGGEKRVKNTIHIFGRNTASGVADIDYDKLAGFDGIVAKLVRFRQNVRMSGNC